jgi:hypothetical protein
VGLKEGSKSASTPGVKAKEGKEGSSSFSESMFGSIAARGNRLALHRADMQFAMEEIRRNMANPSVEDWLAVKYVTRYLSGASRVVLKFVNQDLQDYDMIWTDSDYAGSIRTKKSSSGGCGIFGYCHIEHQ